MLQDHYGWAESIARAVARAWNLDWRLDGLDGAAMEALIFCSSLCCHPRNHPLTTPSFRRLAGKSNLSKNRLNLPTVLCGEARSLALIATVPLSQLVTTLLVFGRHTKALAPSRRLRSH